MSLAQSGSKCILFYPDKTFTLYRTSHVHYAVSYSLLGIRNSNSGKKWFKKFFLMVENQKSDSKIQILLNKSSENVSLFHPTSVPHCSAKICCSPYVVLYIQVNSFSITTCAFLCQSFEICGRKFLWITPTIIVTINVQLRGCVS